MHAYFDPLGFGVLSRSERRSVERDLQELHDEVVLNSSDVTTDESNDQSPSMVNSQRSSKKSKMSTVGIFMDSLHKKDKSMLSSKSNDTKSTMNDEISTYRLLAQKEYNLLVHGDKDPNTVSIYVQNDLLTHLFLLIIFQMQFWKIHQHELKMLSTLAARFLATPATSVPSESAFSTASYLLRKQRSCLSPLNLSFSLFLKDKMD